MRKLIFFIIALFIPAIAEADHLESSLERCKDMRGEIETILESEGVSKDFFFLALAESGCRSDARSNAGAVGLWQLSKPTARTYGLTVNEELDERLDWRKSTRAAARYIAHLEESFDGLRWVVAAYNAGGSNLKRKIKFRTKEPFTVVRDVSRASYELAVTVDRWRKADGTNRT